MCKIENTESSAIILAVPVCSQKLDTTFEVKLFKLFSDEIAFPYILKETTFRFLQHEPARSESKIGRYNLRDKLPPKNVNITF